jgi:hypothetical protein
VFTAALAHPTARTDECLFKQAKPPVATECDIRNDDVEPTVLPYVQGRMTAQFV